MAFAWYENDQAIVTTIARVQVDTSSGAVRVKRIVVAHDCGLIINPDGLKNQIEGNTIQSLSRALKEEVQFDEWRIKSVDWDSYPILTFSEVPEVEIVLINRPDLPGSRSRRTLHHHDRRGGRQRHLRCHGGEAEADPVHAGAGDGGIKRRSGLMRVCAGLDA